MKINKDEFIQLLKEFKQISKDANDLDDAFKQFEPDFSGISFARYEEIALKALEIACEDSETQWIRYFVYDLEFGQEWIKGKVTDKAGKDIPLRNPSDLYKLLTTNKTLA